VNNTIIWASSKEVKMWDAMGGRLLKTYRGLSRDDISALCLDFRRRKFILGDQDGKIQVRESCRQVKRIAESACSSASPDEDSVWISQVFNYVNGMLMKMLERVFIR
jgi:hypothetical protein